MTNKMEFNVPYQFNNREVDEDHYQVIYQGKELPVEPKVFDLILYLIKHRDRIVSRDELFEKICHDADLLA